MKFFLAAITAFVFSFCSIYSDKAVNLIVSNKSQINIDSIRIRSYGVNEIFKNLGIDSIEKRNVVVTTPKNVEGDFTIVVFQKDSIVYSGSFGYHDNSFDIHETYRITVLPDFSVTEKH